MQPSVASCFCIWPNEMDHQPPCSLPTGNATLKQDCSAILFERSVAARTKPNNGLLFAKQKAAPLFGFVRAARTTKPRRGFVVRAAMQRGKLPLSGGVSPATSPTMLAFCAAKCLLCYAKKIGATPQTPFFCFAKENELLRNSWKKNKQRRSRAEGEAKPLFVCNCEAIAQQISDLLRNQRHLRSKWSNGRANSHFP